MNNETRYLVIRQIIIAFSKELDRIEEDDSLDKEGKLMKQISDSATSLKAIASICNMPEDAPIPEMLKKYVEAINENETKKEEEE